MSSMKHIVKRGGHHESYDSRKIYASVYAACMTVRMSVAEAELIADKVTQSLNIWVNDKQHVNSSDICTVVTKEMKKYNRDAAYLYAHHTDVS